MDVVALDPSPMIFFKENILRFLFCAIKFCFACVNKIKKKTKEGKIERKKVPMTSSMLPCHLVPLEAI